VAIGRRAGNGLGREGTGSADPILDNELLPEHLAQALSCDPRNKVGIPARSVRNENFDWFLRPTL